MGWIFICLYFLFRSISISILFFLAGEGVLLTKRFQTKRGMYWFLERRSIYTRVSAICHVSLVLVQHYLLLEKPEELAKLDETNFRVKCYVTIPCFALRRDNVD